MTPDPLQERVARVLHNHDSGGDASASWAACDQDWYRVGADAVLAVLRDTPTVCRTCGSDNPKVRIPRPARSVIPCPDPFHSQGEPCELCGGTGLIGWEGHWDPCPRGCTPPPCDLCGGTGWVEWDAAEGTPYEGHYPKSDPCPRGCKPEGEKK